jgi:YidC/Oxa1 family membrane protein insertase
MSWFDGLLWPIMWVVAWIMVQFHALLSSMGMDPAGGAAWALSIVGLVVVIRIILIPLFVRQIKASRGLQLIQPEMQAIQKKYKGKTDPASREAMSRETMDLYKKHGTNPFSSCLPILAQSPIFFALFRVLNSLKALAEGHYASGTRVSIGPLTQSLASQAEQATVFGAPLSGTFMQPGATTTTRIVTVILILAMSVTTFTTQRQLTMKNMPPAALEGPIAQQQKMLLYLMPLMFAFSGINFPIGVLIYWTTTNLWSMGQQFYTIRRMPAPGSQAEAALKARQARKSQGVEAVGAAAASTALIEERPRGGQRQQPVRKDRAKKSPGGRPEDSPTDATAEVQPAPLPSAAPARPRTEAAGDVPGVEIPEGTATEASADGGPRKPRKPTKSSATKKSDQDRGQRAVPEPQDDAGQTPAQ